MIFGAMISALVGAIAGFAFAGFGAAMLLVSIFGHRDGGVDMGGFFVFGPIGGIAGALLGAGLAIRFGGGPAKWGLGLLWGALAVTILGGILLAVMSTPEGPSYSHVIEFELEVPASSLASIQIPGAGAMWGGARGSSDDKPISQFFEKKCSGDVCIVNGSIAALGEMNNFRIAAQIGPNSYRYPLELPAVVVGPVDWSAWKPGDGSRLRWRIVKR